MKIIFDPASIDVYISRGVHKLHVFFIQSGCAGTKVDVQEDFDSDGLLAHDQSYGITVYIKSDEAEKLDNGRLTKVGEKWIFTS